MWQTLAYIDVLRVPEEKLGLVRVRVSTKGSMPGNAKGSMRGVLQVWKSNLPSEYAT